MFKVPSHSRSVMTVFTESFGFYKSLFLKVLPWTIAIAIFQGIGSHITLQNQMAAAAQTQQQVLTLSTMSPHSMLAGLANLFMFLSFCCLMKQFIDVVFEKKLTPYSAVAGLGLARGIVALLTYLVLIVVIAAIGVGIFLLVHKAILAVIILSVMAVIVSVWLSVNILFWVPKILSGENPIQALKSSFSLIKNNWWRTFGLMLLVSFLGGLIAAFVGGLTGGLTIAMNTSTQVVTQLSAWPAIVGAVINGLFVLPWGISVLILQMQNLEVFHKEQDSGEV